MSNLNLQLCNYMPTTQNPLGLSAEKRSPRAKFSKKLARICEKLDRRCQGMVEWKNHYNGKNGKVDTCVESLWAFGSYARGSEMCGNLDIVVKINDKAMPFLIGSNITKEFFGTLRDVSVYVGTPHENQSRMPIDDAILIWSGPDCDWKAAIEAIATNPEAGRHPRETDEFPIRFEQVGMSLSHAELLLREKNYGKVKWTFSPFEIDKPVMTDEEQAVLSRLIETRAVSKTGALLLPHVLRTMNRAGCDLGFTLRTEQDKPVLDDTVLLLGPQNTLSASFLDNPTIKKMAVVPKISARGPNGIWWIERGDNHALNQH